MFQALNGILSGARDLLARGSQSGAALQPPRQLELELASPPPRDAEQLLALLQRLGLRRISELRLTRNRNIMVSFVGTRLRVHEGYLSAPDTVMRAIVTFVEGRTRAERKAAQAVIVTHPIEIAARAPRREHNHPDDDLVAAKLRHWHARYNAEHFNGELAPIRVRVSRRMKSRLGHYSTATVTGEPPEIAISRRHLRRHGWQEALHTLLHEMVHQWQDETKRPIDHGRAFRAKARQVGITPYARRTLTRDAPVHIPGAPAAP